MSSDNNKSNRELNFIIAGSSTLLSLALVAIALGMPRYYAMKLFGPSTPKCTDEVVLNLVNDLSRPTLTSYFIDSVYQQEMMGAIDDKSDILLGSIMGVRLFNPNQPPPPLELYKKSKTPAVRAIFSKAEREVANLDFTTVVKNSSDDKLKKISCSGVFAGGPNKQIRIAVDYAAQVTEDEANVLVTLDKMVPVD